VQPIDSVKESSSDVVLLADAAGTLLRISTTRSTAFGYSPEELVGRNVTDLAHPTAYVQVVAALRELLAAPLVPIKLELLIEYKAGLPCSVETTISHFLLESGVSALFLICRDTSVQHAARDLERAELQELLRANGRLEDLVYAVAHDLRENFRTVSAFSELLLREVGIDARSRELADFVRGGVVRMSSQFENLYFSAIQGLEDDPQPVNLETVLAEVVQGLTHVIGTSNAVVTAAPLPIVLGNDIQLARVFQNLIVNAIKYRSAAPIEIHIQASQRGPDWIIKVSDNGIGIAGADHMRVFRFLSRPHGPELPGAGIGLALCKKLVEAMGGTIWVESNLGAGSTFCFVLASAASAKELITRIECLSPQVERAMEAAN
jgi:PAS domain S-box-containing protein